MNPPHEVCTENSLSGSCRMLEARGPSTPHDRPPERSCSARDDSVGEKPT
jgi:hypothetical protein